jgi:hypothetical protein
MKPKDSNGLGDSLRQALREWKVDASLPPRFQEGVWRKIERSQARPEVPDWLALFRYFSALLRRPALAFAYVTTLLLVGLLAGYWQSQVANAHTEEMLSARYIQMLDPYRNSTH